MLYLLVLAKTGKCFLKLVALSVSFIWENVGY